MRRIKIAIIGSSTIEPKVALKLARAILKNLNERYTLSQVITIVEDPLGKAVRSITPELKHKTYSDKASRSQSNPSELTAGSIVWATTNYILVHDGSTSWSEYLSEILDRHRDSRRYKLLEISR